MAHAYLKTYVPPRQWFCTKIPFRSRREAHTALHAERLPLQVLPFLAHGAPMTKEELIARLSEPCGDPEVAHGNAEDWLLAFVNDPEIQAAWEEARDRDGWWYA